MDARNDGRDAVSAEEHESRVTLEDKGLVASLTDCLSFSPAFTLTGFETMNDKVLREMNERAKHQLGAWPAPSPESASARVRPLPRQPNASASTQDSAATPAVPHRPNKPVSSIPRNTSSCSGPTLAAAPPGRPRLFGAPPAAPTPGPAAPHAPARSSAHASTHGSMHAAVRSPVPATAPGRRLMPAPLSPPKRANAGLESPSKRLRAPSGAPAPASPTASMSQLSLNEKERLTQVSAARLQTRRENASPRRRQLHRTAEHRTAELSSRSPVSLNARPLPSLKLEQPSTGARMREPVGKQADAPGRPLRRLGERPNLALPPRGGRCVSQGLEPGKPGVPRSSSMRSVSATATSGARTPPTEFDSLPSYARPTKAALRRSQSSMPHQPQGLSQHLRPSSSTRSVSRLLN